MPEISVLQPGSTVDIGGAINMAAAAFDQHSLVYGHGTDDALSEASWLILHGLGLSPVTAPDYQRTLTDAEIRHCNTLLSRRINDRIPAAYITGTAWFAGLSFKSDERALVPRSPLAEFILHDFFELIEVDGVTRILDLCTGGGCIGIACAIQVSHAAIDASDLSLDALNLAAENVASHQLQARVNLVHSSLFDNVTGLYDLIISNPPYVDANDIQQMGEEFEHEPLMGLAAGRDGLDLVRQMLFDAARYLNTGGLLVVEVGNSAQALEEAYPDVPFLWLQFQNGGSGVFALTREELVEHAVQIEAGLKPVL